MPWSASDAPKYLSLSSSVSSAARTVTAPCWRTSARDIKGCSAARSGSAPLERLNAANSASSTKVMNGPRQLFMIFQSDAAHLGEHRFGIPRRAPIDPGQRGRSQYHAWVVNRTVVKQSAQCPHWECRKNNV